MYPESSSVRRVGRSPPCCCLSGLDARRPSGHSSCCSCCCCCCHPLTQHMQAAAAAVVVVVMAVNQHMQAAAHASSSSCKQLSWLSTSKSTTASSSCCSGGCDHTVHRVDKGLGCPWWHAGVAAGVAGSCLCSVHDGRCVLGAGQRVTLLTQVRSSTWLWLHIAGKVQWQAGVFTFLAGSPAGDSPQH